MTSRIKTVFFVLAVLIVLWLAFGAKLALAGDNTLTWKKPTETESCTNAGPLTNLAGTRIWQLVADIPDPDIETYTIEDQLPGTYEYVATSYDETGAESRVSGKATKTVDSFIAVAGSQAYQPVMISNGWWMIPMATMDADTECDVTQNANGYYRVPPGSYTWLDGSTARPVMLVAECG
jgi:hypothetical protein